MITGQVGGGGENTTPAPTISMTGSFFNDSKIIKLSCEEVNFTKHQQFQILERTAAYAYEHQDNKPEIHIMIDTETRAKGPKAAIASIGIVPFIINGPTLYELAVHERFDWKDQIANQAGIEDPDTAKWWDSQSDAAKEELAGDASLESFLLWFTNVYMLQIKNCSKYGTVKVWSKSPSFDLIIINSWLEFFKLPRICQFFEQEDVRTRLSVASLVGLKSTDIPQQKDLVQQGEVPHNAYDDACLQVFQIGVIHAKIRELTFFYNISNPTR